MWSNFHGHTYYCDGKGTPEEYLVAAAEKGVKTIGFSSHAPLPFPCKWSMKTENFPRYLAEIRSTAQQFPDIEIYTGLEVDFIPDVVSPSDFRSRLDYTIGSIHFVDGFEGKRWEIDNTLNVFREGLEKIFRNDIQAAIGRYQELTREMIMHDPPDVVGHLDKIKIHNLPDPFFEETEGWYIREIDRTLKVIKDANIILEVNTRGLYKKKSPTTYPSPWILERALQLQIPVTLSSDAHHPDDLIREFERSACMLKDIGFQYLSILKGGIWKQVPFNAYGIDH